LIFFLTDRQAATLRSLAAGQGVPGQADRWQARILTVLVRRGLIDRTNVLTPAGSAAVALIDKLAIPDTALGGVDPRQLPLSLPTPLE
jgi:hypothetical protein